MKQITEASFNALLLAYTQETGNELPGVDSMIIVDDQCTSPEVCGYGVWFGSVSMLIFVDGDDFLKHARLIEMFNNDEVDEITEKVRKDESRTRDNRHTGEHNQHQGDTRLGVHPRDADDPGAQAGSRLP